MKTKHNHMKFIKLTSDRGTSCLMNLATVHFEVNSDNETIAIFGNNGAYIRVVETIEEVEKRLRMLTLVE